MNNNFFGERLEAVKNYLCAYNSHYPDDDVRALIDKIQNSDDVIFSCKELHTIFMALDRLDEDLVSSYGCGEYPRFELILLCSKITQFLDFCKFNNKSLREISEVV